MSYLPLILYSAYFASEITVLLSLQVQFISLFYLPFQFVQSAIQLLEHKLTRSMSLSANLYHFWTSLD